MKVLPARCLVIEDSVPGVTGARAPTGMTVARLSRRQPLRADHAETLRAARRRRNLRRYAAIARP